MMVNAHLAFKLALLRAVRSVKTPLAAGLALTLAAPAAVLAIDAAPTPAGDAAAATPVAAAPAAPATPAVAPAAPADAAAKVQAPAAIPARCRPGTDNATLASAKVEWHVSPCFGGIAKIRLLDKQFSMPAATPPAGMPEWAAGKFAAGPLDLVGTWDAQWDPFREFFDRIDTGDQPVTERSSGQIAAARLGDLAKRETRWGVVEKRADAVVLAWPDPQRYASPLYLIKRYSLGPADQPYLIKLQVSAVNVGNAPAVVGLTHDITAFQPPGTESGGLLSMFAAPPDLKGAAMHTGEETIRFDAHALATKEKAERSRLALPEWLGVESRYFLMASAPVEGFAKENDATLMSLPNGVVMARLALARETLPMAPGGCVPAELASVLQRPACSEKDKPAHLHTWLWELYTGPKDVEQLKPAGRGLVESIDFGWFGSIALPMLWVLRKGHDLSGSWPVAILLLTLLVKAMLWPVTMKSMRSMKKMSQLKPELDKLRAEMEERAKKLGKAADPQEINKATFDLYRQHNVNPVGGCLPLLLQMPVYIALYRAINASVSLYNQPLFGWIGDMTQKDPYYVLPLVLGVVMFLQQKLTPQAAGADPAQQKMMLYFMPVLFTLMMLGLPSGLTLYILANTALSVLQTVVMQRSDVPAGKPA